MSGRRWLVGDALTAADVTAGVVLYRVLSSPLLAHPPAAESLQGWIDRVMVFDRYLDRG
jgi:glutathione S-transferase